jgi:(1->4)-alpha-D-glucan 1-alpha-D-glucosylmutase
MLRATYRVQLNHRFTLRDAIGIVPYLDRLGVSHMYCSPILAARPGSLHGYDVVDPTRVNPELGTEEDLRELADRLAARGMGILLDLVPNHMGVGSSNPYWEDVLTNGRRSRWARWFDVEWDSRLEDRGRVVLPVLGDALAQVMERGELGLSISESHGARITYFESSFPLNPATLPEELQLVQFDPNARDAAVAWASGNAGRKRLAELLERQNYRLLFWREGPRRINYRRFFDVNDLVAIRVEDPDVFAETHATVLQWIDAGLIQGLRIDHIDGLLDPLGYLEQLRDRTGDMPIYVEKILSPGERLAEWPVQGTTGYEFMNQLEAIFISPRGAQEIESAYRRLRRLGSGRADDRFPEIVREGKMRVLRGPLRADMGRLARRFAPLLRESMTPMRAAERTTMVKAIIRVVAALPVYRTYIDGRTTEPHEADRDAIARAVDEALVGAPEDERTAIMKLRDVFLSPLADDDVFTAARLDFILRFQQMSGPATAKGVEDTALYVHVPLASRNEVGGEPDGPLEDAAAHLHDANVARAAEWPQTLNATNTHDTKRSADVRSRLDVLSETPRMMRQYFARWRRLNRRHRRVVRGRLIPDSNTEYLLYQTLLGIWPPPRTGRRRDDLPEYEWLSEAKERLRGYMTKAIREAKRFTSWTDPDEEYERAVASFVDGVLDTQDGTTFLGDVSRFTSLLAATGIANAVARITIHLTAPGVPDLYQGDELWNYALVDPDNRRPVDYTRCAALLDRLARTSVDELTVSPERDELKLWVTHTLLMARKRNQDLFTQGGYEPLEVAGGDGRFFAYARWTENEVAVVAAERCGEPGHARGAVQRTLPADAAVVIPERFAAATFVRVLGEERVPVLPRDGRRVMPVENLLGKFNANMVVAEASGGGTDG